MRPPHSAFLCTTLAFTAAVLAAPSVAAQEANPDVEACEGKKEGAPCERTVMVKPPEGPMQRKTEPGTCQPDECCELDYSKGSPPQTNCGPCLACKGDPSGSPPDDGDPPAQNGSAPNVGEPEPEPEPGSTPIAQSTPGEDPPAQSSGSKRGCAVARGSSLHPAWLAAGLWLVVVRRRNP